jgi:hypothetical protein
MNTCTPTTILVYSEYPKKLYGYSRGTGEILYGNHFAVRTCGRVWTADCERRSEYNGAIHGTCHDNDRPLDFDPYTCTLALRLTTNKKLI